MDDDRDASVGRRLARRELLAGVAGVAAAAGLGPLLRLAPEPAGTAPGLREPKGPPEPPAPEDDRIVLHLPRPGERFALPPEVLGSLRSTSLRAVKVDLDMPAGTTLSECRAWFEELRHALPETAGVTITSVRNRSSRGTLRLTLVTSG